MIATILLACSSFQAGGSVELIHKKFGVQDYAEFGTTLIRLDDVDLDGVPDYAIGSPMEDWNGFVDAGAVRIYSGLTHNLISTLFGTSAHDNIGIRLARITDANGDGRGDYATNWLWNFPVAIVSAVDGQVLHAIPEHPQHRNGVSSMTEIGDVDGDGKSELAIGDSSVDSVHGYQAGMVFLHAGADYALMATLDGLDSNFRFGSAMAAAGDLNGDLIPDLFVGAPGHILGGRGHAYAYSGADLTIIHAFAGANAKGRFGTAVDGGSDVDGDGVPDLLVSAPFFRHPGPGAVVVLSGATGALILMLEADQPRTGFGMLARFSPDLDGDGQPDILVLEDNVDGEANAPDARVLAISSFDGERLAQFWGDEPQPPYFGGAMISMDDQTGDGLAEVMIGSPREYLGVPTRGAVYLYSFRPQLFLSGRSLSAAAGGTLTVSLRFPGAAGGHQYRILASISGASPSTTIGGVAVPLVADSVFQSTLAGFYPPYSSGMTGVLNGSGQATAVIAPGPGALKPGLIGRTIHLAAVEGTSSGPESSSVQQGFLILP